MHLHLFFVALALTHLTHALVTQQTIRNLTALTEECRERITGKRDGISILGMLGEQSVLGSGHGGNKDGDNDGGEVEDTVAAALRILCSDLLVELEKPLYDSKSKISTEDLKCRVTIREYHAFLAATVKFLNEIHERQMVWGWGAGSAVFDGVSWLQGLWASRSTNNQDRSFIEQQMTYYGATGCFGKSQEVLERDVEVVEYMNDLIDSFG